MQEITVKKQEIVKINGKRVLVNGDQVKVLSKEDSSRVIGKILDEVYTGEIGLYLSFNSNEDESGNIYFSIFDPENLAIDYKIFPRFLRPIIKPENYGLENKEGTSYYIHFDGEKALLLSKDGYIKSIKDITDDLIDGKLIK